MTDIGRLVEVEPRTLWAHEAGNFTPWLLANADVLGDELGISLALEGAEHRVGDFALDLLGVDNTNEVPLIVENQLEATDHDHLGKLLTYAAGTDAKTIIWISTRFRQEHRSALDWLNVNTQESIRFFGVELHAGRIGESAPAPLFKVVVEPSDWQKRIRTVAEASKYSGRRAEYREFWQRFLERARSEYPRLPWRNTAPRQSWLEMRSPISGSLINLVFGMGRGIRVELYIDSGVAEANQRLFGLLERNRELLEREIGSKLEWDPLPTRGACRISAYMPGGGVVSEEDRHAEFISWFLATGSKWMTAATQIAPQLRGR